MFKELDFPVQLVDIPHPYRPGRTIPDRKAVIRGDNDEVLNIVSNRYQLVSHQDVFSAMSEAIEKVGVPVRNVSIKTGDGGGSARAIWTLDRSVKISDGDANDGLGDTVNWQIVGQNSYNYMSMVGLGLGGLRLVCTNGARAFRLLKQNRKRHVPSLSVPKLITEIMEVLENSAKVEYEWRRWDGLEYLPPRLNTWLESRQDVISKKAREEVVDYFHTQPNRIRELPRYTGWEAYNALTWFGTHRVSSRVRSERRMLVAEEMIQALAEEFAAVELKN